MYSLIVAVLGLVIFIYMFDVLRKRSSMRTKRVGLIAWLLVGLLVTVYGLIAFIVQDGGFGFVFLFFMSLLFWVMPTGLLLWLNTRKNTDNPNKTKQIEYADNERSVSRGSD